MEKGPLNHLIDNCLRAMEENEHATVAFTIEDMRKIAAFPIEQTPLNPLFVTPTFA